MERNKSPRMKYLDSMRGIASLIVVSAHYLAAFYPYTLFGSSSAYSRSHDIEEWLLWPPFSILTAGKFAICLFFVLSGYVLAVPLIGERGKLKQVVGAILKRPIRLGGLVAFSILLAAILWWGNAFVNIDVTKLPNTEMSNLENVVPWFAQYWLGGFTISNFVNDVVHFQAGREYNPPLWTLYIEFYGSFYVFFSLLVINWFGYAIRTILLVSLLFLTYGEYYDGFFFGMLVADAQKQTWSRVEFSGWWRRATLIVMASVAVLAMTYPFYGAQSFWNSLVESGWPDGRFLTPHVSMIGAMLVFFLVVQSPAAQKTLEYPLLTKLGDISFAIYVLHFLLLGSLSAWLVIWLTGIFDYNVAVLISAVFSFPILIWLSVWATTYIDKPIVQFGRVIQTASNEVIESINEFWNGYKRP